MNLGNTCTISQRLKNIRVHSSRPSVFLFVGNIYIIIIIIILLILLLLNNTSTTIVTDNRWEQGSGGGGGEGCLR